MSLHCRTVRGALVLLALLASEAYTQQAGSAQRKVVAAARVLELASSSPSLSRPLFLRGTAAGILVMDAGDNELKLFDREGRRLRVIGRHGSGPGEYREVMDVQVAPSGRMVLADPKNGRVAWYDEAGNFLGSFKPGSWTYRALPMNDSVVAIASLGDSALVEYVGGRRRGAFALPTGYGFLDTLAVAGDRADITGPDGSALMVWLYTGVIGRLRPGSREIELHRGVAGAAWPAEVRIKRRLPDGREAVFRQLPSEIRPVVRSMTADGRRVAILAFKTEADSRHIDVYDSRSLAYACSVRVPDRVQNIAFSAGRLFGLVDDPEPMLIRIEAAPTAGTAPLCAF